MWRSAMSDFANLKVAAARLEGRLQETHQHINERFDQLDELLQSSFRSLHEQVQSLKRN
jgi:hypothetical protein